MREPFERAVQAHGPTVLRVCRAVLGADEAEDAWSETFLAALRAWPDLPDRTDVRAWLVTVAHRKAVDVVRRNARATPVAEPPDRAVHDEPRDLDLWQAVAALPHKQRHAVALHHLGGLPYDEVAALLGGSSAAARRAASDGVAALRVALGADAPRPTAPTGGRP
ncbi:RNA polymerase sigma factor [Cellulomonas massiliensis]|uniref:RNA polymerase sigma factor n=1 Tax=Cellulomonas massiliensis TaxID=1465811 RepID=UPI00037E7B18|nr:sigma-70 family RNA polymerase sigma factor [Cellulomonas massiliensis]